MFIAEIFLLWISKKYSFLQEIKKNEVEKWKIENGTINLTSNDLYLRESRLSARLFLCW